MKDLKEILGEINKQIEMYETLQIGDVHTQSDIGRKLAINIKYLGDLKLHFKQEWNKAFIGSDAKSDKKKEIDADEKVPELYVTRQVLRYSEGVLNMIRTSISANKGG